MADSSFVYLFSPTFQFMNISGKPLADGYIEVYIGGTRSKYYAYSDFDGTLHPFKIPLNALGSAVVLVSPANSYDVYVYNSLGVLQMSRYNITPATREGTVITVDTIITSEDRTVNTNTTAIPEGVQYDLSVNTEIIATKSSVDSLSDQVNTNTLNIGTVTDLANENARQIISIRESMDNDKWVSLTCTPYDSNIELVIINAGYRNGFLNFNGTVRTKVGNFATNKVNYIFRVNDVSLLLDFRNYYGSSQYSLDSSSGLFPCAMAGLRGDNLFYIFPTKTCDYFYFNGTVPVELIT